MWWLRCCCSSFRRLDPPEHHAELEGLETARGNAGGGTGGRARLMIIISPRKSAALFKPEAIEPDWYAARGCHQSQVGLTQENRPRCVPSSWRQPPSSTP